MTKIKIGVIFGGMSSEHEISVISGSSVLKNLNKEKYEIYPIYISKEGEWFKYSKDINEIEVFRIGEEPQELKKINEPIETLKKLDVIFPVLHGLYGEDGTIQGMLELIQKPYVGCKVLASSLCMDKVYSKIIFEKAGIEQAKYIVIKAEQNNFEKYTYIDENLNHKDKNITEIIQICEGKIKYPVFVKPSNSGSSVGVSKARNKEELKKAIKEAQKYDTEILIEEAITGKEIECAVLGTDIVEASCVGEVMSADQFYDYNSKYKNAESKTIIPAEIKQDLAEKVRELAIKAFKAVNGSGIARVDFFVNEEKEKIYINEINTMPGFTTISMYPQLWQKCGLSYEKLLDKLIENEL